MITFGGERREINWHTLGHIVFGHFYDGTSVTVAQVAVPCFNIGYACDEGRVASEGGRCLALHEGELCGEDVEAF